MISLSACIVTKNSEHLIEKTLRSIWNVVDEIIIVDRGSCDGTGDVALKFTDKVFSFEDEDYEKIVNFAVDKATKDYVFLLNPGEFISENEVKILKELKEKETPCKNGFKVKYDLNSLEKDLNFNIGRIIKRDRISNYKNVLLDWFDLDNLQSIDLNIKSQNHEKIREAKLENRNISVLIGSVICEKSKILTEFLLSLKELNKSDLDVSYCFIDSNESEESSNLLSQFSKEKKDVVILKESEMYSSKYYCNNSSIDKIANLKNSIINYCVEKEYDYLFLIDSDIILHDKTLKKLIQDDKYIISNIFWTRWKSSLDVLPQVWVKDNYTLYDSKPNEIISEEEVKERIRIFLNNLRKPGVYKVGGLGECTLIKRLPLIKGVNFSPLYNISYSGEYRHFCIRAVACGFELYVDTNYPAYHIYNDADLEGVFEYKEKNKSRDLEIEVSKIFDLVTEAVQAIGTMSYEDEEDNSWIKYFTIKEGSRQKLIVNKVKERFIKDKIINECKVLKCDISIEDTSNKSNVVVKFLNEGYENDISFCTKHEGTLVCIKQNDRWLINEFNIKDEA